MTANLTAAILITCGLGFLVVGIAMSIATHATTPVFEVGDCVFIDTHRESWEKPVISRIAEVGQRAYRVQYRGDGGTWLPTGLPTALGTSAPSIEFAQQHHYTKLDCPEGR